MMFRTYHHRDGIVHAEFTVSIGGPVLRQAAAAGHIQDAVMFA